MSETSPLFDGYAGNYDAALAEGLQVTGEDAAYFARRRVAWMQQCLARLNVIPRRVLDFGCGTGGSVPYLLMLPGVQEVVGVDISESSLDVARARHSDARVRFAHTSELNESGFDLAFCNGVFHHIPVVSRLDCARYVLGKLNPRGLFALWENNPWNPGTRYIMSRVAFDADAVTLSPPQVKKLLRDAGFSHVNTSFLFIFPRLLKLFRPLESVCQRLPLGGQFVTLEQRP